jgi:hypothetical protein
MTQGDDGIAFEGMLGTIIGSSRDSFKLLAFNHL